jgi:hypothetical protein
VTAGLVVADSVLVQVSPMIAQARSGPPHAKYGSSRRTHVPLRPHMYRSQLCADVTVHRVLRPTLGLHGTLREARMSLFATLSPRGTFAQGLSVAIPDTRARRNVARGSNVASP